MSKRGADGSFSLLAALSSAQSNDSKKPAKQKQAQRATEGTAPKTKKRVASRASMASSEPNSGANAVASDAAPAPKKRKYTRRKQPTGKPSVGFGGALRSTMVDEALKDQADGAAHSASVSSATLQSVTSSFQARKPTQTVLANGDASLTSLVRARQTQFNGHQAKIDACAASIQRLEQQLRGMKRTRRNIRSFNETSDALQSERRRLTLLELQAPPIEDFYSDLNEFLRLQAEESAARRAREEEERLALERRKASSVDNASGGSDGATDTVDATAIVVDTKSTSIQLAPSHRARAVTAGAPLFDGNQFALLRIARADLDSRVRASMGGVTGAGAMHSTGSGRVSAEDALFNSAIARATRSSAHAASAACPMAFVLSPLGRGIAAPCVVSYKSNGSNGGIDASIASNGASAGRVGTNDKRELIVVTIGKNNGGAPSHDGSGRRISDVGAQSGATTTRDNRNRLNVKMKDIRNMQNVSMMNFVAVSEREQTLEERQHDNFRHFLNEREEQRLAAKRPRYDDSRCERCEALLDINLHSGMVSCTECGLAYDDGIDCHEWQAIDHVPHSKFEYLKSGHLMTLLKRFQAKESTVIPRDVIDKCALQLSN